MPVCLHCGELAPDGALFCTKCGYTLPQLEPASASAASPASQPSPPAGTPSEAPRPAPAASRPGYPYPSFEAPSTYLAPTPPGAVGPMPPPAGGKYCIHSRTIISHAAVYCPVCQRPQA